MRENGFLLFGLRRNSLPSVSTIYFLALFIDTYFMSGIPSAWYSPRLITLLSVHRTFLMMWMS